MTKFPLFSLVLTLGFVVFLTFTACEAVDNIIPSASTYKISAMVNGTTLDDCSYVAKNDKIRPFFEEPVSGDFDITSLVVFLRTPGGEVVGNRVVYIIDEDIEYAERTLVKPDTKKQTSVQAPEKEEKPVNDIEDEPDNNEETEDEPEEEVVQLPDYNGKTEDIKIFVKSLDDELPLFSLPQNLEAGRYILVYQIMGDNNILQKIEKTFFYLGDISFSFKGIDVHQAGVAANPQLIPRGSIIMLEAVLDFDSELDPYIIWYSGRKRLSEGRVSENAHLFWKAPELSGFFPLRVEVFPIDNYEDLAGYQKEISVLVSSKPIDINLISEKIPELKYWYIFESNLYESIDLTAEDRVLVPASDNEPVWMASNGTYGLASGINNMFLFPAIELSKNEPAEWQILFRFKPLNEGELLEIKFNTTGDVALNLSINENNLVFSLISGSMTVSQEHALPDTDSFVTCGLSFTFIPDDLVNSLSASINIVDNFLGSDLFIELPISQDMDIDDEFRISFGTIEEKEEPLFTAIWDEFCIYNKPPMELIIEDIKPVIEEDEDTEDPSGQIYENIYMQIENS